MSNTGPGDYGIPAGDRPHAYDPLRHPEQFEGVLARRLFAFVIDVVVISIPVMAAALFFLFFGLITFGLGWLLAYWVLSPIAIIWALFYYGMTLGGPHSATVGMRVMNLQLRTWYGGKAYFVLGVAHAVIFWLTISLLTPLILIVGFFNRRRRLLHDMALGTVVINAPGFEA